MKEPGVAALLLVMSVGVGGQIAYGQDAGQVPEQPAFAERLNELMARNGAEQDPRQGMVRASEVFDEWAALQIARSLDLRLYTDRNVPVSDVDGTYVFADSFRLNRDESVIEAVGDVVLEVWEDEVNLHMMRADDLAIEVELEP